MCSSFKHTSSIPVLLNFSFLEFFGYFGTFLLFLSSFSAILLGDMIASKNESFTKSPGGEGFFLNSRANQPRGWLAREFKFSRGWFLEFWFRVEFKCLGRVSNVTFWDFCLCFWSIRWDHGKNSYDFFEVFWGFPSLKWDQKLILPPEQYAYCSTIKHGELNEDLTLLC